MLHTDRMGEETVETGSVPESGSRDKEGKNKAMQYLYATLNRSRDKVQSPLTYRREE